MLKIGKLSEFLVGLVKEEILELVDGLHYEGMPIPQAIKDKLLGGLDSYSSTMTVYRDSVKLNILLEDPQMEKERDLQLIATIRDDKIDLDERRLWDNIYKMEENRSLLERINCSVLKTDDFSHDTTFFGEETFEDFTSDDLFTMDKNDGCSVYFVEIKDGVMVENKELLKKRTMSGCKSSVVEDEKKDIRPSEQIREKLVDTVYDALYLYAELYSLGLVFEVDCFEAVFDALKFYYNTLGICFRVSDEVLLSESIKQKCFFFFRALYSKFFNFSGGQGLFPNALYFITGSLQKYRDVFRFLGGKSLRFLRVGHDFEECQGDPLHVSIMKGVSVESIVRNYMIEDTSLHFSALGYKCGTYIKELMELGSDRLSTLFRGSTTLWISVVYLRFKRKTVLFVAGSEGIVGPVSSPMEGCDFDEFNYLPGMGKSVSSMTDQEKDIVSPRMMVAAMILAYIKMGKWVDCFDPNAVYFRDGRKYDLLVQYRYCGEDVNVKNEFFGILNKYLTVPIT